MEALILPSRRGFLRGLGVILAAPAVVTASNLMPISMRNLFLPELPHFMSPNYAELAAITRHAFVPRLFVQVYSRPPLYDIDWSSLG